MGEGEQPFVAFLANNDGHSVFHFFVSVVSKKAHMGREGMSLQSLKYVQCSFYGASNNIAVLTLNDPKKLNAFHLELTNDLLTALDILQHEDFDHVRVVILTGAGRAFSAGGDTSMMGDQAPTPFHTKQFISRNFSGIVRRIVNMPQIVIACVNGLAMGVAFFTVLACDYVICEEKDAFFNTQYMKIGLAPLGIGYYLGRKLGHQKALEYCAFSRNISAREGKELGFVNEVVVADNKEREASSMLLQEHAIKVAGKFAQLPKDALAMAKKLIRDSATQSLEEHMYVGSLLQPLMIHGEDHKNALKAMMKKKAQKSKL